MKTVIRIKVETTDAAEVAALAREFGGELAEGKHEVLAATLERQGSGKPHEDLTQSHAVFDAAVEAKAEGHKHVEARPTPAEE